MSDTIDTKTWASQQPDAVILAATLLGEARGEDRQGREMIASVVMTRVAFAQAHRARVDAPYWWGETPREVCLAHMQFDCWNPSDPNYAEIPALTGTPLWAEALEIATTAISGALGDQANGSTHYLNPQAVAQMPSWATAANERAAHLHHVFYRVVP